LDEEVIAGCYPDPRSQDKLKNINNLAHLLEKLLRTLLAMETQVKMKNTSIIRFWSELSSTIAQIGEENVHFLFECSAKAQKLDKKDQRFLAHPDFIKLVQDFFEKNKDDIVIKFMASYYTILWEIDPNHLLLISEKFESPNYESLYKFSSTLF
jgi:hypothetical protein